MQDIKQALQRIDELMTCTSLTEVLDGAYSILHIPILALDMEYKLIAAANVECDDVIWREFIETGRVSGSTIEFFKTEDFIDLAANTNSIAHLRSDKLRYDRIFGKLFNADGIQIGSACGVIVDTPYSAEELAIMYEQVCKIASIKMHENYFKQYGQDYQKRLIKTMIENSYEDRGLYAAHVANMYVGLDANIYLLVVDDFDGIEGLLSQLKRLCRKHKYYQYNEQYVVLLSYKKESEKTKQIEALAKILAEFDVYGGCSRAFDNLFMLDKYYNSATAALQRAKNSCDRICVAERE